MYVQLLEFPDYLVGSDGRVFSLKNGKCREVKGSRLTSGYQQISLCVKGVEINIRLHRLIAQAFYGRSALTVNHKNGVKTDNRLDNLEYCSQAENIAHAWATGLANNRGERSGKAKLTDSQVASIRELNGVLHSKEVAKQFNVSETHVRNLWANKQRIGRLA